MRPRLALATRTFRVSSVVRCSLHDCTLVVMAVMAEVTREVSWPVMAALLTALARRMRAVRLVELQPVDDALRVSAEVAGLRIDVRVRPTRLTLDARALEVELETPSNATRGVGGVFERSARATVVRAVRARWPHLGWNGERLTWRGAWADDLRARIVPVVEGAPLRIRTTVARGRVTFTVVEADAGRLDRLVESLTAFAASTAPPA